MRCFSSMRYVVLLLLVGALFTLNGCALWNQFFGDQEKTAKEYMDDASEDFNKGNFEEAAEGFQKVKDRYPYSKFSIDAELKMADAFYNKEKFDEAYDAYSEFERLHPKHASIPYVMYQKGMCQFRKVTAVDRDQTHTVRAKEEFDKLIKRFRKGEYVDRAKMRLRDCLISMSQYELTVGRFYFKQGYYIPALARYRYVLETYPDLGQYHEAMDYIARCNEKIAEGKERPVDPKDLPWYKRLFPAFSY